MHLLERQTQLDELARRFQEARKGCGKLVLISAETGLGKLSPSHPLRLALGELTGHHVVRMRLVPLSPAAVELLSRDSGRNASLLYRITGGNPFFVREVLASPGELVPQSVRDAVVSRLLRCSPETRELAELVAISPGRAEGWPI